MLRFASLSSGSKGNCLVVEARGSIGATRVLIDCGLTLRDTERRLARLSLAPGDIDAILVTHEHGDHACGVFDFAAAHHVAVYLTRYHETYEKLLERGCIMEEDMNEQFRFHHMKDLKTGRLLFSFEHEMRSLYHPDFGKPLVNRIEMPWRVD